MGTFHSFGPPPALSDVVDAFWCHVPAGGAVGPPPHLRVLPDGCIDLIARFDVSGHRAAVPTSLTVSGPTDRYRLVELPPSVAWAGVRFRPWAAGPLLAIHPPELFNRDVDALDCSPRFVELLDRIAARETPIRALAAMRAFLLGLAARTPPDPGSERAMKAVGLLGRGGGMARVSGVAKALGVGGRTLHRDVHRSVGLPPKVVARIFRFQASLARLRSSTSPDLCAVALDAGYSDQSHMTREFQALAGITPGCLGDSGPTTGL